MHLPIDAQVQVTAEGLDIHAVRKSGLGAHETADVHIPKEQIIGIDAYLMPDIPDNADPWSYEGQESYAVVRHADRFEVVPFFESRLTSGKTYWLKALTKAAKERLGVEATVTENIESTS